MPCYHIIRKHASMSSSPALKRCFRSRSHADTVRVRGAIGDRSDYYLDRTLPGLAVSACYHPEQCECAKWPQGHNAEAIPVKPARNLIMCERCNSGRRNAVELIDPRDRGAHAALRTLRRPRRTGSPIQTSRSPSRPRRRCGAGHGGVEQRRVNIHTGHNGCASVHPASSTSVPMPATMTAHTNPQLARQRPHPDQFGQPVPTESRESPCRQQARPE